MLENASRERDEENGVYHNIIPGAKRACTKTHQNYKTLAATQSSTTITKRAVQKTEVRETTENSFRSTMAFAMTSAVTLFQVGPMQPGRPPVSNATEGAQLFEKLVSKANNDLPVQPLQCGMCSSTDDSGEYYVVGINSNGEYEWRIVKNSGEDKGVHSTYHSTKKAAIIGQRAKLTWTASNDGTVAAPYVSFLGMSERELPKATCPSGVHKIRGTCRRPLDPKEVALFYEHFTVLYESHVKHGKIPEELFDELGFVEDVDSQGMVRQRRSETDVHSRAMCLSAAPIRAAQRLKLEQEQEQAKKTLSLLKADNKTEKYLSDKEADYQKICQ